MDIIKVELVVVRKGTKYLFVNGVLSTVPDRTHCMKSVDYYQYMVDLYRNVGQVTTYSILYLEQYMRAWPKEQPFPWWQWAYMVFGDHRYYKMQGNGLICQVVKWRHELGDVLTMDRLYNEYTAWRIEQETRKMLEIL